MNINLLPIEFNQKQVLVGMMQKYLHELATFCDIKVDKNGFFDLGPYFNLYWQEAQRHPFFILNGGSMTGFALVREYDCRCYEVAEFFVLQKYRRSGAGARAATTLFHQFNGSWRVCQHDNNVLAQLFWRNVIGRYTNGNFQEKRSDQQPCGPMQVFISGFS